MGPIQVVVTDANNLILEVTPTAETSIVLDRGVAGPTGMVWEGNWSSATYYSVNDAVYYVAGNASYICILANTNQVPTNATYWQLLVSGAGDVTGAASSTDNAVVRFSGTTGKLIQNSAVLIGDDGSTIISTSSTTNALRITQTGTGNAFLVEDTASTDSSPFVINADGFVKIGTTLNISPASIAEAPLQVAYTGSTTPMAVFRQGTNGQNGAELILEHARNGTTNTALLVGDSIGEIRMFGADGTNFIEAASITSVVDGTPGQTAGTFTIGLSYNILTIGTTDFTLIGAASNTVGLTFTATGAGTGTGTATLTTGDMPGRLVFSTTPDGSGTPIERVRINSVGEVGVGTVTPVAQLGVYGTGQTTAAMSTSAGLGGTLYVRDSAAGAGNGGAVMFGAAQGAFAAVKGLLTNGASNTVGDLAFSTRNAAADAALTERMRIGSTGAIGFNSTVTVGGTSGRFRFGGNITGAVGSNGLYYTPTIQSDVTTSATVFVSQPSTVDAAFPLGTLSHFLASQSTITGGSRTPPTNQVGFQVNSSLIGAINNFAYRGELVAGTGRWNLYMSGTADNYLAGNLGIGTTTPQSKLDVNGDITLSTSSSKIVGDSVTFQANTANAGTTVQVTPNGTGNFSALDVKNGSGFNFTRFSFGVQSSGTGYISGDFNGSSFYGPFHLTLAGGTGGMYWDIDGNAGLGTTSPTTISNFRGLSINATSGGFVEFLAASTSVGEVLADANGLQVTSVAAKPIILKTNDTDRVTIDSAGSTYIETGNLWQYAPAPTSKSTTAALTAAELFTGILQASGASYLVTVPTGTSIDAFYPQVPAVNIGFDFYVINTGTGTITMVINTGVTSVGALTIPTATSAMFRFRRTAANTYVMYRLR